MAKQQLGLFHHLTHRSNVRHTRYGWLRLTPAYSVQLVEDILHRAVSSGARVLDPFCGTGTTALVCAERGISADTTDINPFLLWLTKVKTQTYTPQDLIDVEFASGKIAEALTTDTIDEVWAPSIHQIEKWWNEQELQALGRIMHTIGCMEANHSSRTTDLLKITFCRVMITHSSASFNHQSMSFKKHRRERPGTVVDRIRATWNTAAADICSAARTSILLPPGVLQCDARHLSAALPHDYYTCVITSPPYPNRMSYMRELRPYMYWLGYVNNGREAGELDWKAIGGTWGIATSNVGKWTPPTEQAIPYIQFRDMLGRIAGRSDILSRYVHKYFYDMVDHVREVFTVTRTGGSVHYIVGNSKFYDVLLPVEEIFAALFEASGFIDISIKPIRKRTSKKELYEYVVSAIKP